MTLRIILSILILLFSICNPAKGKIEKRDFQVTELNSKLTIKDVKLAPGKNGAVLVDLNGNLEDIPFSLRGNISNILQLINPDTSCRVSLVLKVGRTELVSEGTVKDLSKFNGMDINFKIKDEDFSTIGQLIGNNFPLKGTFELSGRFKDISEKNFRISNLKLVLGKSEIEGELSVDLSQRIPAINAEFYTPYLNLREVLKERKPKEENFRQKDKDETSREVIENKGKVFSNKPFNLEKLKRANINVKIKVETGIFQRLALRNFQFGFKLKEGVLMVDPLEATAGGGDLKGWFEIEPFENGAIISGRLNINDLDLKKMQKEMKMVSLGKGTVEFGLDLTGHGNSVAEVMAALNGNVSLIMGEGWIDRDYLKLFDFFGTNLKTSIFKIIKLPRELVKEEKNKFSEFNCFVVRFDLEAGNAEATALVFDTQRMSIVGTGNIDLEKETLNIYLEPISKEGIGGEGFGKLNLSLSELVKPFKLGGTLADPDVVVNPAQTALTLGKAIGGAALFGPAGIVVALLTGTFDKNAGNPCLGAIEAAQKGVEVPDEKYGILKKLENFLKYLSPIGW